MEYIKDILNYQCHKGSVITLGKFDGVHRGHQKLIRIVKEHSSAGDFNAVVFTFQVSPQVCMGSAPKQELMTNREKEEYLRDMGIDILIECPFTEAIRTMSAEDFVREILIRRLQVRQIVIGSDFHFGRGRQGDADFLIRMGKENGFGVCVEEKERDLSNGREISSSYIREELSCGHIEKVRELLGYPYFIAGEIVHGRHLGHTIGIPTINQMPEPMKMLPPDGVYYSRTKIGGKFYFGITNIGEKPTVSSDRSISVETNLFDFRGDVYGKTAVVELFHFSRPEKKFGSVEELKSRMERDIEGAKVYFHAGTHSFSSGESGRKQEHLPTHPLNPLFAEPSANEN